MFRGFEPSSPFLFCPVSLQLSKEHEQQKSTIEPSESIDFANKKAPEGANFNNGGNDEARTRDLLRDRQAL